MENENLVYYCYEKLIKTDFVINNKDDLIQEGLIALYNATKTYKIEYKTRFSTYATSCIKNAMNRYLKKQQKYSYYNCAYDSKLENVLYTNNFEEKLESKLNVEYLLKTDKLCKREKLIIKYFLKGYSRSKIKQYFNINDRYLYTFFIKIKDIINGFTY